MAFTCIPFCVSDLFCILLASVRMFFPESPLCLKYCVYFLSIYWPFSSILNKSQKHIFTKCANIHNTWMQEFIQRSWRSAIYRLAPHGLLSLFGIGFFFVFYFCFILWFIEFSFIFVIIITLLPIPPSRLSHACHLILSSHTIKNHQPRAGNLYNEWAPPTPIISKENAP